jgi:Glycosyl hydrolases family 39
VALAAAAAGARHARTPSTAALFQPGPLTTAVLDQNVFLGRDPGAAVGRIRAAGATMMRLTLYWKYTAPSGKAKPMNFDASNPDDPFYDWSAFDAQLQLVKDHGLEPIVCILLAPEWAEGAGPGDPGTNSPNVQEFAKFARAAARRYDGRTGRPRIRYWQVWNEPNLTLFLNPTSPDLYRSLVNSFADAVKRVRSDNVVIAGGTSPFGFKEVAVPPLRFMRELLCMSAGPAPKPTCQKKVRFDVWAHHPYTTGGPTHKATNPDDASLGDLPQIRRLLVAAAKAGHIVSPSPLRFWVTEFSWDSDPPDPVAVPSLLHARWVAEAMYRMWSAGVSLVTWFQLQDDPLSVSQFQSGLYFNSSGGRFDRPKLALRAFRFPFVALSSRGGVRVWGRTPSGRPGKVVVERQQGRGWKRVVQLATNRYGIFGTLLRGRSVGPLRARLANGRDMSVPFSLTKPPDRYYWPFGCGGVLACTANP